MSTLYESIPGTPIGTRSVGPIVNGIRQMRFTWHINPLEFYQIAQRKPIVKDMTFDDFIIMVSKCQIQEVDLYE